MRLHFARPALLLCPAFLPLFACTEYDSITAADTHGALADAGVDPDASTAGISPALRASGVDPDAGWKQKSSVEQNLRFGAPSGVFTVVPYSTLLYNDVGNYDPVTHGFAVGVGDDFRVCAALTSDSAYSQVAFELDLFINGVRENAIAMAYGGKAQGCRTVRLQTNDYLDVRVHQSSPSTVYFSSDNYWSWMTVETVRYRIIAAEDSHAYTSDPGVFTVVPYDTESADTFGEFDPATHQITKQVQTGVNICASAASFGPNFELDFFIDGFRERALGYGRHGIVQGCRTIFLGAGQTLDIRSHQASPAVMNVSRNTYWNWMTVDWVAPQVALDDISAITVPRSTFTVVQYNSVAYDVGAEFDVQRSRMTAHMDGDYHFCAALASFAADFELNLFVNGQREKAFARASQGIAQGCRTIRLKQNDYVEVRVYQEEAASMVFNPNRYWNWLTVDKR